MKKKKGEVHLFIMQFIGIFICFGLLIYSIHFFSITIAYNNMNQAARKCILKMERVGYLTQEELLTISDNLNKNSYLDDIRINVSNLNEDNKAKYGDDISITITAGIKQRKIKFEGFFLTTEDSLKDVVVSKASTSRW